MIKRALGLSLGDIDASDSEEELTESQKRSLSRKLLPGFIPDDEDKGGDGDGNDEGDVSDDGVPKLAGPDDASDNEPAMPAKQDEAQPMRGNFQCVLCPNKVLLTEKFMEVHLMSAVHKRREKRALEIGLEAFLAERAAGLPVKRVEAKPPVQQPAVEAQQSEVKQLAVEGKSKRKQRAEERRAKQRESWLAWSAWRKEHKKTGKEMAAELTPEQIEAKKAAFQAKKARRLERKSNPDAPATADKNEGSDRGGRKAKKAKPAAADTAKDRAAPEGARRNRKMKNKAEDQASPPEGSKKPRKDEAKDAISQPKTLEKVRKAKQAEAPEGALREGRKKRLKATAA